MTSSRTDPSAIRQLMKLAGVSPGGQATDRELIERFLMDRSESAFADLMARHGPMVLAVCRRHIRDTHAADDAFQACFLVLARKAGRVRWRESIGGWLFEVATRVAKKIAAQAARRIAREGNPAASASEPVAPAPPPPADLTALQAALDEELGRLPEKLRAPVVLCHLEGLSQDEVARHLGVTDGQLRGRLYRAKEKLRERLVRRGFSLTAVLLALTVGETASAIPAALATATARLAAANPNTIPIAVHLLAHGVIRDMTTTLKTIAVLAAFGVLTLAGAGYAVHAALADPPPAPRATASAPPPGAAQTQPPVPPRKDATPKVPRPAVSDDAAGYVRSVDAGKNILIVGYDEAAGEQDAELTPVTKVFFDNRPAALADLKPGMRIHVLWYTKDSKTPDEVRASWKPLRPEIKAVDAAKRTVTFETEGEHGITLDVTLPLAPDATITLDGAPVRPGDIPLARGSWLSLSADKKSLVGVMSFSKAFDVSGKGWYDAKRELMTVNSGPDKWLDLPVAADAKVTMDGEEAKITDVTKSLRQGKLVLVRLTADRKTITGVVAVTPDYLTLPQPNRK
jgi:RNA polymerase sigma factor (sigma-70 family)